MKRWTHFALLLAAVLAFPTTSLAQAAPSTATRWNNLREARKIRIVKVDSTGKHGDFARLSDALAWVASVSEDPTVDSSKLPRDQFNQWTVVLFPGKQIAGQYAHYQETSITIPDYVTIQGYNLSQANINFSGMPILELTGTSGALISPGYNTNIINLDILYVSNPTAATSVLRTSGSIYCTLSNVNIAVINSSDAFALDLVSATGDSGITLHNTVLTRTGTSTKTRHLASSSSDGIAAYGGRYVAGSGQLKLVEATAGTIRLFGARLQGSTTQLTVSGSGAIEPRFTQYSTFSGTITDEVLRSSQLYVTPATPASASASCSQGQITADSGFVYVCTATNTWKRAAIATW